MAALFTCNCGGNNAGKPDTGGNPPLEYDDAGNLIGKDGGGGNGIYTVECTGPAEAVPVNTQVTIDCVIDSKGASLSTPLLSVSPSDGIEMANDSKKPGVVYFALSTGKTGYSHPKTFQDTTYTLTVEVHNAANAAEFGRGTAKITVLGNYWIGDASSSGQGIHVFRSDGKYLAQAVGPAGVTGVKDLMLMPNGDIAVTSSSLKTVKIFDRQGKPRPVTFATTDKFAGDITLWEGAVGTYDVGPARMALSSVGELWVGGAFENLVQKTYGIAVFNPTTGDLVKFLPHPENNYPDSLVVLARRSDGKMLASTKNRRVCIFDEKSYASDGCFPSGNSFTDYNVMMPLENEQVMVGVKGDSTNGDGLLVLGATLTSDQVSDTLYNPDVTGLVRSGAEILALGVHGNQCCDPQLARFDAKTLKLLDPIWHLRTASSSDSFYNTSGIVRLTVPGT